MCHSLLQYLGPSFSNTLCKIVSCPLPYLIALFSRLISSCQSCLFLLCLSHLHPSKSSCFCPDLVSACSLPLSPSAWFLKPRFFDSVDDYELVYLSRQFILRMKRILSSLDSSFVARLTYLKSQLIFRLLNLGPASLYSCIISKIDHWPNNLTYKCDLMIWSCHICKFTFVREINPHH